MNLTVSQQDDRKSSVRRTAIGLALLAAAFYVGFILISILRGQ